MPLDILVLGTTGVFVAGGTAACARRRLPAACGTGARFHSLDDREATSGAELSRVDAAKRFVRSTLLRRTTQTDEITDPPSPKKLDPWVERATSPTTGTPWAFQCPIGLEPMVDPVRAADGVVYERENIATWLRAKSGGELLSPVTGERLQSTQLVAERTLKREINTWRAAQAKATEPIRRIDVCIYDFGEIAGLALRRQKLEAHQSSSPPVVSHVIPGSLAAKAGARPGDHLVCVDSAPLPDDAQGPELVAILASAGRPVHLTLARSSGGLSATPGGPSSIEKGEHIIL